MARPKGHPDLPLIAAALDSPEWGRTRLLQAAVLPHQFDMATGRGGMPFWRVGLLVDLGTATETVALALFTCATRAEAGAAAAYMASVGMSPPPQTSRCSARRLAGP